MPREPLALHSPDAGWLVTIGSDRDVVDRRLAGLGLVAPSARTPEDVLRWMIAVQSQDIGPAKWSTAQRVHPAEAIREPALDAALADGRILRTHVLRPTWHFVLPDDIRWLVELTGPRIQVLSAFMHRTNDLTESVRGRSNEVIERALEGGGSLTRAELRTQLDAAGFATDGFKIGYLMMHAEVTGLVCSGPPRGATQTYALLADRAPNARHLDREEGLAELARRYFTSHGPATVKDFRTWSSLTAADARLGLEGAGPTLVRERYRDLEWWYGSGADTPVAADRPTDPSPTVHLIQAYDEYLMGYLETRSVVDIDGAAGWVRTERAIYVAAVLLDGQFAGHWKRTITDTSVHIDVQWRLPFDAARAGALQAAADRHGAFLGVPATVTTTQLGAH